MNHAASKIRSLCVVVCFAAMAVPASAATITAADYVGGGTQGTFGLATGWAFTPTTDLLVTALGIYDLESDGLADRHEVGIFTSAGAAVISTFVGAGTSAPLTPGSVGGTRFVNVPGTMLLAGMSYYIVASNFSTDQFAYGNGAVIFNPAVVWNGFVDCAANDITSACAVPFAGAPGNLGPNFAAGAVPEPATLLLLGTGLSAMAVRRRRVSRG